MSFFLDNLQIAYETAYSDQMDKKYKKPKIYHGGKTFDLKKRWYVYYSFLDPETGEMKRQTPITLKVNRRFKTKKERLTHLEFIRKALEEMLKNGFNPYESELTISAYTARAAIDYALSIKKESVGSQTFRGYESIAEIFKRYLKSKGKIKNFLKPTIPETSHRGYFAGFIPSQAEHKF